MLVLACIAFELVMNSSASLVPAFHLTSNFTFAFNASVGPIAPRAVRETAPGQLLVISTLASSTGAFVNAFLVNNTGSLTLSALYPAQASQLAAPVALDRGAATGNVFVCDPVASRVVMFAPNRTFLRHVGTAGLQNEMLSMPVDLVTFAGHVYVVDVGLAAVLVFNETTGAFLARFSVPGLSNVSLASLAVAHNGAALGRSETLLVVCDSANMTARSLRVRAYTLSGKQRWSWTAAGYTASSMVVTGEGLFLALDVQQGAIVAFNGSTGALLTATTGSPFNMTWASSLSLSLNGTHIYVADPTRARILVLQIAANSTANVISGQAQYTATIISAGLVAAGGTNLTLQIALSGTYSYPTPGGFGFISQLPNASCDWISGWVNSSSMQVIAGLKLSEGLGSPLAVRARLTSRSGNTLSLHLEYSRHRTLALDVDYALTVDLPFGATLATPCGYAIAFQAVTFDALVPSVVVGAGPLTAPPPLPIMLCGLPGTSMYINSLEGLYELTHRRCTHIVGSLELYGLAFSARKYRAALGPLRRITGCLSVEQTSGLRVSHFSGFGVGAISNIDPLTRDGPIVRLTNNINTQELATSELRQWVAVTSLGLISIKSQTSCLEEDATLSISQFSNRFAVTYDRALADCTNACQLTEAGPYCTNEREVIDNQCERDIVVDGPGMVDVPLDCSTVRSLTVSGNVSLVDLQVCVCVCVYVCMYVYVYV
jgi:hypothetical protein